MTIEKLQPLAAVSKAVFLACWGMAFTACVAFASTSDDNTYALVGDEVGTGGPETGDCADIPFGRSCQEGAQIYNVTFNGIITATGEERDLSLEDIHCDGYDSALLFSGDLQCEACSLWVTELGKYIGDIHDRDAALVASYTSGLGSASLSNEDAETATEEAAPDYVTGSDMYVYPCRYTFTPFLIAVDLNTATILYRQSPTSGFPIEDILNLLEDADRSE
jgi:hypothetical protein